MRRGDVAPVLRPPVVAPRRAAPPPREPDRSRVARPGRGAPAGEQADALTAHDLAVLSTFLARFGYAGLPTERARMLVYRTSEHPSEAL
jgi:hypothetical protein